MARWARKLDRTVLGIQHGTTWDGYEHEHEVQWYKYESACDSSLDPLALWARKSTQSTEATCGHGYTMDVNTLYEVCVYADMYFCPMGAQDHEFARPIFSGQDQVPD